MDLWVSWKQANVGWLGWGISVPCVSPPLPEICDLDEAGPVTVVAKVQERKNLYTSTIQASSDITHADIPLAKASHMAKCKIRMQKCEDYE
jgi:hypothetical protein